MAQDHKLNVVSRVVSQQAYETTSTRQNMLELISTPIMVGSVRNEWPMLTRQLINNNYIPLPTERVIKIFPLNANATIVALTHASV